MKTAEQHNFPLVGRVELSPEDKPDKLPTLERHPGPVTVPQYFDDETLSYHIDTKHPDYLATLAALQAPGPPDPSEPFDPEKELRELGEERDQQREPKSFTAEWAPGDEPFGESLNLNEYPVALLKMKKCRSFRADLYHKLTIIMRASGGYGSSGLLNTAKRLRVNRTTMHAWLTWRRVPRDLLTFERIDAAYSEALERLVAGGCQKRKRKRK